MIDRGYLVGLPGACPVTILLGCQDGHAVEWCRRTMPAAGSDLPRAAAEEFDVILINPGRLAERGSILRLASRCLDRVATRLTVALRLGRRLGADDAAVARHSGVWTFIRSRDARHLVRQAGAQVSTDTDTLVRCLCDHYGIARLVLQRGPRGAVLMNGIPCPYRVQACPLAPVTASGAGDTLLAVTALSSASGSSDRTSIRRGVAAATGQVARVALALDT